MTNVYLAPTTTERNSKEVASHIVYINRCIGQNTDKKIVKAAANKYGNISMLDSMSRQLCDTIINLTEAQANAIIWDGRNANARKLADWWETHQGADIVRLEKEIESIKKQIESLAQKGNAKIQKLEKIKVMLRMQKG